MATTLIDIDYYEELKRKADQFDRMELMSIKPGQISNYEFLCQCGNRIMEHYNYCNVCGRKFDWGCEE